ncbi:hypothetical protein [Shewanella gelidii]|uniref:Uncharacterized protein n=1 Tax=Shewanella gelidii TaxID=1642821 RepID=A0A917K1K6_9GAMM|nr:hypothetical protein [Shewanella gelidii]MCL1099716.1 hypothetical protein [Shewanella gelidii]GGI93606.1 hypothetical protein GCM10009332_33550 [Shewanella gelidii]
MPASQIQARAKLLRLALAKFDVIQQLSTLKSWLIASASITGFVVWIVMIAGLLHPVLELISA